jgi:hypothetical protein
VTQKAMTADGIPEGIDDVVENSRRPRVLLGHVLYNVQAFRIACAWRENRFSLDCKPKSASH